MKEYKVILHSDAESDIESSFKWGCRAWGQENAKLWARELRRAIRKHLTSLPLACPLAPESEQLGVSIRHLIVGRYRVGFKLISETDQLQEFPELGRIVPKYRETIFVRSFFAHIASYIESIMDERSVKLHVWHSARGVPQL